MEATEDRGVTDPDVPRGLPTPRGHPGATWRASSDSSRCGRRFPGIQRERLRAPNRGRRRGDLYSLPTPERPNRATLGPRRRHSHALPCLKMAAALSPEGRWPPRGSLRTAQARKGARLRHHPAPAAGPAAVAEGVRGRGGGAGPARFQVPPGLQQRRGRVRVSWAEPGPPPWSAGALRLPPGLVTRAGWGRAGRRPRLGLQRGRPRGLRDGVRGSRASARRAAPRRARGGCAGPWRCCSGKGCDSGAGWRGSRFGGWDPLLEG